MTRPVCHATGGTQVRCSPSFIAMHPPVMLPFCLALLSCPSAPSSSGSLWLNTGPRLLPMLRDTYHHAHGPTIVVVQHVIGHLEEAGLVYRPRRHLVAPVATEFLPNKHGCPQHNVAVGHWHAGYCAQTWHAHSRDHAACGRSLGLQDHRCTQMRGAQLGLALCC